MSRKIFVTGGTGYVGRSLIPLLLDRGHELTALVRERGRSIPGCENVIGDALNPSSYDGKILHDTFIHLVGVSLPARPVLFRSVDLQSALVAIEASALAGIRHFIYVSVAQPAPVMKEYVSARRDAETAIRASGLNATILRPWYVLGPGHRWPAALHPFYWLLERFPPTADGARRLGLVTIGQVSRILALAVEDPARGIRILDVAAIRRGTLPA